MPDRQLFELLSSTLWLPFGSYFILTLFLPFPFFLFLWGIVSVGFFCSLSLVACTGLLGRLFLTTLCTIRWWFCRTNSSQLESQKRVRVGGWGTRDMQSSCAASWRQMFVLPSLLGRRRRAEEGVCLFHAGHSICGGKKKGTVLSLLLPLSALLLCLHLTHFWLSPSGVELQGLPSFQLLPTFFLFCSKNKKGLL